MTELMKVSGLPGAFVNCPAPYLVKCWSFLKGLSCQGTIAVCVADEAWQCPWGCPHSTLQPVAWVVVQ